MGQMACVKTCCRLQQNSINLLMQRRVFTSKVDWNLFTLSISSSPAIGVSGFYLLNDLPHCPAPPHHLQARSPRVNTCEIMSTLWLTLAAVCLILYVALSLTFLFYPNLIHKPKRIPRSQQVIAHRGGKGVCFARGRVVWIVCMQVHRSASTHTCLVFTLYHPKASSR